MISVGIANLFKKLEKLPSETKEVFLEFRNQLDEMNKRIKIGVTKEEFKELKDAILELTEAQKETEKRLAELIETQKEHDRRLSELTNAQKETEKRLVELIETQKEHDRRLSRLEAVVADLTNAQKETEKRLAELIETQKEHDRRISKLETAIVELTNAQKETEKRLSRLERVVEELTRNVNKLTKEVTVIKKEIGGLSRTVAYALENEAFRMLPKFLKERYNIEIIDRLIRTEINGREVNFFAKAVKNGEKVFVIGESTLRFDSKKKLSQILKSLESVTELLRGEVVPILVTHYAKPKLKEEAEKRGILVIQSFEWI